MVNVSVFIEGGVLPNEKHSVLTVDNSEKLREGFYSILSQIIPPSDFNLTIKQGSGNKQTIKYFKNRIQKKQSTLLLIDLDKSTEKKDEKITEFELTEYSENVFFMVQEMEAWIISQINIIDDYYTKRYIRLKKDVLVSNHKKIKDIHPEEIRKPSIVLKEIIGQFYKTKQGKKKKYGKLKDGSELLSILNASELQKIFSDFNELIVKIKST
ncbi:MAG: DUF4276 family protein [Bacteroidota bacterium]|nr:DUF4276 family protein [Bacteroidota bacterium]